MRLLASFAQVPHVRQHYNWDCGLACVLMVLRAMGVHGIDFYTLRQCCGTTRCESGHDLLSLADLVEGGRWGWSDLLRAQMFALLFMIVGSGLWVGVRR